ncbi:hypothetical protein J5N97_022610 [Dioscorea zingiberensis]|uniref:Uncharacterized protein n=1 Tax=Dioscorea zingiberensis TaxID=325984 RepID=A0A9D5CAQ9_9LILI|nr:hypothetical protein J5N97_022610 [Dioscorea zingiberensis]
MPTRSSLVIIYRVLFSRASKRSLTEIFPKLPEVYEDSFLSGAEISENRALFLVQEWMLLPSIQRTSFPSLKWCYLETKAVLESQQFLQIW